MVKHFDSIILSVVYTIGHIVIAGTTVYTLTGSTLWEAGLVALVEPTINGLWFYTLHRLWKYYGNIK